MSLEYEEKNITFKKVVTPIRFGIDVGSTTVKVCALSDSDEILFSDYVRHKADIRSTIIKVVTDAIDCLEKKLPEGLEQTVSVKVTGSGGLAVSQ